ncbi:MAG: VOC family protein [Nocardioidaceae bacterium]|nr:VOC family protein [Nocardioidaceae bacterium]
MPLIDSQGFAHVRLTVTDIARSKAFYDQVFGWPVAVDRSADAGDPEVNASPADIYGGTIYQTPSGALFGLRPVAPAGQRFDSDGTGLDHVSFQVGSRDDLVAANQALEEAGITHGEVTDLTDVGMAILSFEDPDGVQLELTAALT